MVGIGAIQVQVELDSRTEHQRVDTRGLTDRPEIPEVGFVFVDYRHDTPSGLPG